MAKSLIVSYVLWLTLGLFGTHHFYLKRDRQAFAWLCSFGGFFGLGWFRDFWRLPEYVRDANNDQKFLRRVTNLMRIGPPSYSVVRFLGEVMMGYWFGVLGASFLPQEYMKQFEILQAIVPLFVAFGVHLVGNIGRETVSFKWCCFGAYVSIFALWFDHSAVTTCASFSSLAANYYGKDWKRTPDKRSVCKRVSVFSLCFLIYICLWTSSIYHNATITTRDGENVKVHQAIEHFFNSPAWRDMKESAWDLWNFYQTHGFDKTKSEFFKLLDPEGESYAHEVLGVAENASEDEIHRAYRALVKRWHPDRITDPHLKQQASEKFMQIQRSYETLSAIKSRRVYRSDRKR